MQPPKQAPKEETKEKAPEPKAPAKAAAGKPAGPIYTYVGAGEDSPRVINFMGKQKFVRGQATEVTDPEVLGKIANCPTFISGEVDPETLHEYDEKARGDADAQRAADRERDARWKKKHAGE